MGSDKSMKHELGQFNYSFCYLCLHGGVLASLPLTQEVVGLNIFFFTFLS